MKTLIAAATLAAVIVTPAAAISRYNTDGMSCREAQRAVRSEGAVILRYQSKRNPGMTLYGRYVSDVRFCQSHEITEWAWVPTADTKSCRVFECRTNDRFDHEEPIFRRR